MASNFTTISKSKVLTVSYMLSRTQVFFQLMELQHYKFCSYKSNEGNGKHLVTLYNKGFAEANLKPEIVTMDYIITEEKGYLSAVSRCGRLSIAKLT